MLIGKTKKLETGKSVNLINNSKMEIFNRKKILIEKLKTRKSKNLIDY